MKHSNTLARIRRAPGSPPSLPVRCHHMRQEPGRTDEPAWLGSFFSLWLGDYTGQRLLSLQKNPLAVRLDEAVCPDVPVTHGSPPGTLPRFFPTPCASVAWDPPLPASLVPVCCVPMEPVYGDGATQLPAESFSGNLFFLQTNHCRKHLSGSKVGCGCLVSFHPIISSHHFAAWPFLSLNPADIRNRCKELEVAGVVGWLDGSCPRTSRHAVNDCRGMAVTSAAFLCKPGMGLLPAWNPGALFSLWRLSPWYRM